MASANNAFWELPQGKAEVSDGKAEISESFWYQLAGTELR